MKRFVLVLTFASLVMFSSAPTYGAAEITLDSMTGVCGGDSVMAGQPVRWNFRLTYTPGDGSAIIGFTNGFEVYTHLGGVYTDNFSAITYDTFPWQWPVLYDIVFVINTFSVDGVGADTVGFGGAKIFGPGIVDGTDSLCWWIETTPSKCVHDCTPVNSVSHQKLSYTDTLCIDSAFYPPGGEWLWSTNGPLGIFTPDWSGPHCFHVYGFLPARTVIEPDSMYAFYKYTVDPMMATVYLGDFSDGHLPSDIDPSSVTVNSSITPITCSTLLSHPDFFGEVLEITFPIRGFILGYMPLWDTTVQEYTVSGQFYDSAVFLVSGEVTLVGHTSDDVNADGFVNIADLTYLIDFLFRGGPDPPAMETADLDCNGAVNVADLTYLVEYLFFSGPAPKVECVDG